MDTAGERIKLLRDRRGLSQTKLAATAGISRNHLWRIEKGDRPKVGADVLARLANALGVAVEELIANERSETVELGHAELEPEVADLAQRVNAMPAGLRARVVGLIEQSLDLMQEQVEEANVLPEDVQDLLWYFDRLPEEDRAVLQARADEMKAAERGLTGGQTVAPPGSAGPDERGAADRR